MYAGITAISRERRIKATNSCMRKIDSYRAYKNEKEGLRQEIVEKDRLIQSLQTGFRQQVVDTEDRFIQSVQSEKEGLRQQVATLRQQRNAPQVQSDQSYLWEVP